jgi:death-on-curing protein
MREPQWINANVVLDIHEIQLAEHGGLDGVRDSGLLDSALQAPRQAWAYGEPQPDLCTLAAIYGVRLAKNHAFNDGNKRTASVVVETFLLLNGLTLTAADTDFYETMLSVADGRMAEMDFAEWLRARAV